ncbi:RNA polymerase sigma factor [Paenibacillus ihuae]|uniref:RNA polymerase sigma factor n=1 Tax=Paenibacillus ihuae TaxID=1232431 RepID=UPI0006D59C80|nr:sigma-70 family RNA polymerase sigma factor [Paenibacillus ihuae]
MMILEEYSTLKLEDDHSLQSLRAALNRYCLALTRSGHEAEDLAQDTWTKVLSYGKFSASPNPEALLLRIAKNTWIDAVRRKASLTRAMGRERSAVEPEAAQSSLSEIETAFQALIKHLSPLQRMAFLLRDVLGCSANETAVQLDTTEGAVKAALYRARQALEAVRKELAADGPALPQDADFRLLLAALADAYEQGQIPVMLELLRQDRAAELTMAVSTAAVQAQFSGRCFTANSTVIYSGMRMAA